MTKLACLILFAHVHFNSIINMQPIMITNLVFIVVLQLFLRPSYFIEIDIHEPLSEEFNLDIPNHEFYNAHFDFLILGVHQSQQDL